MRIELSTHKYSIETNFLIITPSRSAPYFLALSHRFCHLMLTSVTEARIFFNNHSHKETTFPPNESRPNFAPFNRPTLSAHVRTTRSLYHLLLKSLSGMVFICKQWSSNVSLSFYLGTDIWFVPTQMKQPFSELVSHYRHI